MRKNNASLIASIFFCAMLFVQTGVAQFKTGSFDTVTTFKGNPNWTLSYYVPPSYNPANKYKLVICLHGLGDTPENMRNYFLQGIVFSDTLGLVNNIHSPLYNNTIILCPYLEGVNTDLWEPVGDTALITTCILAATAAYNIDPDYIYLSGFSIGARAALRYGLINYWRFRGLELWTPAIQSISEANDLTSFYYPWQNGKYIPMYISVGTDDWYGGTARGGASGEGSTVPIGYQNLSNAGGIVCMQNIFGLPHDPPANVNTFFGFNFIDAHATSYATNDAGISAIVAPTSEICVASFSPVVTIQNKGVNKLTSAMIKYQVDNGAISTYNWSGNLIRLGADKVTLPLQTVSAGTHTFKAYTSMPNGVVDTVPTNDTMKESFNFITIGENTLTEGFEGSVFPPAGWSLASTDSALGWTKVTGNSGSYSLFSSFQGGAYEQSTSSIYIENSDTISQGKKFSIRSPICNLSNPITPTLEYDYAYSPYDSIWSDTLMVNYSVDCGNTWDTLLIKGGLGLSTTGGYYPYLLFLPDSVQWQHQIISLAKLTGQPEIMFSFEAKSGYGNILYLDNIGVYSNITGTPEIKTPNSFTVYPNPSTGLFNITSSGASGESSLLVYNILGEQIYSTYLKQAQGVSCQIDLSAQPNGIYLYRVMGENGTMTGSGKLVIER